MSLRHRTRHQTDRADPRHSVYDAHTSQTRAGASVEWEEEGEEDRQLQPVS